MVQLTTAATATIAVILAASAYAAPVTVEGTNIDISARSEHGHTHAHGSHHHATRDLDNVEDLDARFFKHIARKILGREFDDAEELEARFFKHIARKIFGREFDDVEELEARHEHTGGHHHQKNHHSHKVVERALEGMSDEELQARAPIFRKIARKIFGRDLTEEDVEARSPFFRKIAKTIFGRDLTEEDVEARSPFFRKIAKTIFGRELEERDFQDGEELEARHEHTSEHHHQKHHHEHKVVERALDGMSGEELEAREPLFFLGKIAKKVLGRELEEDLDVEARGLFRPFPVGWRGAVNRPREIEVEDSVAARSLEELD